MWTPTSPSSNRQNSITGSHFTRGPSLWLRCYAPTARDEYHHHRAAKRYGAGGYKCYHLEGLPTKWLAPIKVDRQRWGPYEELSDSESFAELLQVITGVSSVIPHIHIFIGQIETVFELYPYLRPTP